MTGSRDLNHPDSSDALTSNSCKYQLAVAGHLVASAMDSYHLIEFKVKRGMIWEFSIPPLGKKNEKKILCPVRYYPGVYGHTYCTSFSPMLVHFFVCAVFIDLRKTSSLAFRACGTFSSFFSIWSAKT